MTSLLRASIIGTPFGPDRFRRKRLIERGLETFSQARHRLLLAPARRNDTVLERAIERFSVALHKGIGAVLAGAGAALASAGGTLTETGQHLHKRVACL
jgi:hypothetical protein